MHGAVRVRVSVECSANRPASCCRVEGQPNQPNDLQSAVSGFSRDGGPRWCTDGLTAEAIALPPPRAESSAKRWQRSKRLCLAHRCHRHRRHRRVKKKLRGSRPAKPQLCWAIRFLSEFSDAWPISIGGRLLTLYQVLQSRSPARRDRHRGGAGRARPRAARHSKGGQAQQWKSAGAPGH
jgi:hypothetical protein